VINAACLDNPVHSSGRFAGNTLQLLPPYRPPRVSFAATRFSRRCPTDEVPGISRIFGARCSKPGQCHLHRCGQLSSLADVGQRSRLKAARRPPRGKNGTIGDCRRARGDRRSTNHLHGVPGCIDFAHRQCLAIVRPSATCFAVTLLRPICRTSPLAAEAQPTQSRAPRIEPSVGP